MEITDVRTVLLTTPYGIEGTHTRRRSAAFIEVETDEGIVGVGETYAGVYVPELVEGIVALYRDVLIGRDATSPIRLYRDCYWVTGYCGRTGLTVMVLAGIECALWDALGKFRNAPLHELLGGAVHDRLPLYASGGVPTLNRDQLVAQAAQVRADGYRGFKMRANPVTYQPENEAERVGLVREALGPDILLAVDAVQNLNTQPWSVKQVLHLLDALAPHDLAWAEEFLPPFDPAPYAELRAMTSVPISGGEGITTAAVFEQWLRAGAFDIAQPDPTIVGGIGEARRACEAADAHHVKVAMHVWGAAPTLTANYHLGFTQPNCVMLERPVMGNPLETEMLAEPLQIVDGYVLPPRAPGLGVELTDDLKAKYPYEPGSASMFG
ncbi:mandelate racemase/muconate lactonizing enzyme family protein [Actinomadura darangshiensis]|uniref:Mandelate racemase/muconate lactonizing enzyme family protein n=1 Tax=Actinomadura darangshiensis TaxID=705336 RepID=A0A4R5AD52_9ACTN|nr:mandelate racemase/muconate lactonizing enzyme family protein [Actinomadura darangshiensis]TDD69186.1 mandelate racemase/muconate lactonizing enzyme family protein [Actinomadura darangshiensis]